MEADGVVARLETPLTGVAAGQALVSYRGSRVVGSATIAEHRIVIAESGVISTGIGSWPGTDAADAIKIAFAECPELPYLPELPARGPHAGSDRSRAPRSCPDCRSSCSPRAGG